MVKFKSWKIVQKFSQLSSLKRKLVIITGLFFAALISVFLLTQSLSANFDQYQQYLTKIIKLQELDATFNQEILKSRYELFTSYDALVGNLAQQEEIQQDLADIPSIVQGKGRKKVESILKERKSLLQKRQELSERFKSRNALLKNSLRYLPLLTSQLEEKFAAQQKEESLDSQQIPALRTTLNSLIRNLLLYNIASEEKLGDNIEGLIKDISKLDVQYELTPEEFPTQLVISHAKIILDTKPQVENFTNELSQPSKQYTQDLEETLASSYEQAAINVGIYRFLSLVWFLLLLGLTNYFLLNKFRQIDPNFNFYRQEVKKITPVLTEISATHNSSSAPEDISELVNIATRQDELGDLAQQVQHIVGKIQQEQDFTDEQSFTSLNANLVLLTRQSRKLISEKSLDSLQTICKDALEEWNCQLINFQGSPEKLEILFSYPTQIKLSKLIAYLKAVSSSYLYQQFEGAIGSIDNPRKVWSDSYSITSCESNYYQEDKQEVINLSN